jgi:hypothetical protein
MVTEQVRLRRLFCATWDIEATNMYYQFQDLWPIKLSRVKVAMNVQKLEYTSGVNLSKDTTYLSF